MKKINQAITNIKGKDLEFCGGFGRNRGWGETLSPSLLLANYISSIC